LRRDAELALDDRIEAWVEPLPAALRPYLATVATETLADSIRAGAPPEGSPSASVELEVGTVRLALRRVSGRG
jgi:hypothetical protein